MMRAYSSGSVAARTIASIGPIPAAITTISSGKTMRMPNTAIRMPQVRNRCCQTGVMSLSLLALTMALSKESEISSTASTAQMKNMVSIPLTVPVDRSEEHTSELQSLMRISYAVFCLKKKKEHIKQRETTT